MTGMCRVSDNFSAFSTEFCVALSRTPNGERALRQITRGYRAGSMISGRASFIFHCLAGLIA